ncbi:AEC family transporter [Martelella endophytica]|uniref:Transporter n=1 Tax=Martelella endophytica TaxID=1486262 RepID=A0A0D5LKG7_MAREN|nr:AEC family transporter [Martelella endophytica]AJY44430.1 transporter [Martelella endophytica]
MNEIFSSVVPIFALIFIGWAAVRLRYLDASHAGIMTSFVFKVALPLLLMRTVANADFQNANPIRIWLAYFGAVAVSWTAAALIARLGFGRDRAASVIIGLSGTFSNLAFLGIPLVNHIIGEEGLIALSLVLAIHMPVMMVTATVLVERAKTHDGSNVSDPMKIATTVGYNLITSPIVVGLAAGALLHLAGIRPAGPLASIVDMLAGTAAPVALISIGMTLTQYKVAGNVGLFSAITFIKLMALPAFAFLFGHLLGLPQPMAAGLVLAASTPAGVNAFVLANQFGTGKNIAASTITLTTALGVLTVSFWVYMLGY